MSSVCIFCLFLYFVHLSIFSILSIIGDAIPVLLPLSRHKCRLFLRLFSRHDMPFFVHCPAWEAAVSFLLVSCARDFHERVSIRMASTFVRFQKFYSGSKRLSLRYTVIPIFRYTVFFAAHQFRLPNSVYASCIHARLFISLAVYIVSRCAVSILSIIGDVIPAASSIIPASYAGFVY